MHTSSLVVQQALDEQPQPREATAAVTLFASPTWFDAWLDAFGEPGSSGWWAPASAGFRIPYQLQPSRIGPLRLPLGRAAANSHTPRFDVCGERAPASQDLRRMMADLGVAALVFPYVSERSRLAAAFPANDDAGSWCRYVCEVAPFVDCSKGSVDDYLGTRTKTRRKNWLYYERRSFNAGARFDVLTTWDEIAPVIDAIIDVEASGWKTRAGGAIALDTNVRRFYETLCRSFADERHLRVFLLQRDGRIIAFQICTLHGGTLSCLKIGYLEQYAPESPGQVIQLQIVRWAFEQRDVLVFDLLGPASETKLKWATGSETLWTYYCFRRSMAGRVAALRWKHAPPVKAALTSLLGRLRAKRTQPRADETAETA